MNKYTNLYLFGFSLRNSIQLNRIYSLLEVQKDQIESIGLVLIHDGVIGIVKNGIISETMSKLLELPVEVLAMGPDLKARGIPVENVHDKITIIDYDDLVDIINQSEKITSWM